MVQPVIHKFNSITYDGVRSVEEEDQSYGSLNTLQSVLLSADPVQNIAKKK